MKKLIVSSVLAFITFSAQAAAFQVTSNEIKTGEQLTTSHVFSGFGCEGGNTSPSLTWSGAPEGTKSFAVTVYDPMLLQAVDGGTGLLLIFQQL